MPPPRRANQVLLYLDWLRVCTFLDPFDDDGTLLALAQTEKDTLNEVANCEALWYQFSLREKPPADKQLADVLSKLFLEREKLFPHLFALGSCHAAALPARRFFWSILVCRLAFDFLQPHVAELASDDLVEADADAPASTVLRRMISTAASEPFLGRRRLVGGASARPPIPESFQLSSRGKIPRRVADELATFIQKRTNTAAAIEAHGRQLHMLVRYQAPWFLGGVVTHLLLKYVLASGWFFGDFFANALAASQLVGADDTASSVLQSIPGLGPLVARSDKSVVVLGAGIFSVGVHLILSKFATRSISSTPRRETANVIVPATLLHTLTSIYGYFCHYATARMWTAALLPVFNLVSDTPRESAARWAWIVFPAWQYLRAALFQRYGFGGGSWLMRIVTMAVRFAVNVFVAQASIYSLMHDGDWRLLGLLALFTTFFRLLFEKRRY